MTKILIADHHPIVRHGIHSFLCSDNSSYSIIGEVTHGDELISALKQKNPCLLLLEINMPGIDGFQILKDIKNKFPKTKIVVFSSFPDKLYAHHCINSGARGYINKTTASEEFRDIISSIMTGKIFSHPSLKIKKQDTGGNQQKKSLLQKLSSRETEVLHLLVAGKRNKDIAIGLNINEKTVSTYKSRLLKKLKVKNVAELITHVSAILP